MKPFESLEKKLATRDLARLPEIQESSEKTTISESLNEILNFDLENFSQTISLTNCSNTNDSRVFHDLSMNSGLLLSKVMPLKHSKQLMKDEAEEIFKLDKQLLFRIQKFNQNIDIIQSKY